jgi:hypothetical protein
VSRSPLAARLLRLGGAAFGRADALVSRAHDGSRALVGALLRESTTAAEKAELVLPRRAARVAPRDGEHGLADWERRWLHRRLPPAPARVLIAGGGAARVAFALLGDGYHVDCVEADPGLADGIAGALADARARVAAELAELVDGDGGERRTGERRGPTRRAAQRRANGERRRGKAREERGFGEWREVDDARTRLGFRERGGELRGSDRRDVDERRADERRQGALARGDATPLALGGRLEELAAAVLDGDRGSPLAVLAGRRYDAVLLVDGALGRVLEDHERVRLLAALDGLVGKGPLLITVELRDPAGAPSTGERIGRLVGRALGRLRRIEAGGSELVFGAAGFIHAFRAEELAELGARVGRALEWDPEPGPPHATLVVARRRR